MMIERFFFVTDLHGLHVSHLWYLEPGLKVGQHGISLEMDVRKMLEPVLKDATPGAVQRLLKSIAYEKDPRVFVHFFENT